MGQAMQKSTANKEMGMQLATNGFAHEKTCNGGKSECQQSAQDVEAILKTRFM